MKDFDAKKLIYLGKCPKERLLGLIHGVIDSLCDKSGPRYQDYSEHLDLEAWWDIIEQVKMAAKLVVKNQWTKDEAEKELEALDSNIRQQLLTAILLRRDEIRRTSVNKTTAISQAHLQDFDWKVNLIMSSDKFSSIQEPILTLDLDIHKDNQSQIKSIELGKDDLNKMITALDAAHKAVSQLKS